MPEIGNSSARAPRGAQPGERRGAKKDSDARGPRAGKGSNFKPREDGRGGRAPHRSDDAPRSDRSARPVDGERKPRHNADDRARRSAPRETRGGRPDNGRDWTPRENKPEGRGGERSGGFAGRDDRGPRRDFASRDDRAPRRDFGDRDNRAPRRDSDSSAPRREWTPERPARRPFGDADRRDARGSFDRDRDRTAGASRGSFSGDRDNRGPRRDFAGRDDRAPRRDFGDRDNRGPRRDDRFGADRDGNRADRVERDRVRDGEFANARNNNSNKKTFQEDVVLERLTGLADEDAMITGTFEEMNLHEKLLAGLIGMGAVTPFPIQAATIPAALEGRDILGRGKTGSGKTVAFAVPVVTKLVNGGSQQRKPGQARALILAPTRELADQIERTVKALARPVGFFTVAIYGGVPQRRQEITMSRGTDIIVATPGRLEDLMAQGIVDLSAVEAVVVDEADHMCDLGFIEPVRRILRAVGDSQKLLFSATLDREVDSLVREFLPDPYIYEVAEEDEDHTNITHRVLIVDPEDRSDVLLRLTQGFEKTLIFTRTKMTAERLSESLTGAGVPAARLHGDLNQNQRNRNLERFVKGHVRVLVATDVAARGIHVDDVALVIQVDPPEEYKTYLHRSGRTGRAGKQGTVVTLIPRSRRRRLEDLLRRADRDGIYTDVRPSNPLLEELAGPIAPPPAPEVLDFGDSRGSSARGGSRDGGSGGRGGYRGGDRDNRGGGARRGGGNFGGNGKGRWADRPSGAGRPRDRRPSDA